MILLSRHFVIALVLLLPLELVAQSAEEKGYSIAQAAAAQGGGFGDSTASGEMVLFTNSGRQSVRRFTSKTLEGSGRNPTANLLVFEWPGDVRDTALLTHAHDTKADDQWLYLPAIGRVKRIASSGRSGAFMGSEFAFEDMVDQGIDEFTHVWVRDERCPRGGGTCHVMDRLPKGESGYSKQRVWMHVDTFVTQQVHYFDRGGKHLKTLSASGHEKYLGQFWRASELVMQNHLTGKKTVLKWSDLQFRVGQSMRDFSVRNLK